MNLGGIHEKLGDFAAAETCFRAAVSDDEVAFVGPGAGWPCSCAAVCRTLISS